MFCFHCFTSAVDITPEMSRILTVLWNFAVIISYVVAGFAVIISYVVPDCLGFKTIFRRS